MEKIEEYRGIKIRQVKNMGNYKMLKEEVENNLPIDDKEILEVHNRLREQEYKKNRILTTQLPILIS